MTTPTPAERFRFGGVFRWTGLRKVAYLARPSATSGWPPALRDGQRVELVHGVAAGQVYFEVRYQATDRDEVAARASVQGLVRDLGFGLAAAFDAYLFEHEDLGSKSNGQDWSYCLRFQPETCRIVIGRGVGVSSAAHRFGSLRLVAERGRKSCDFVRELLPLVRAATDSLEVVVEFKPRLLSDAELQTVSLALQSLYNPDRVTSDTVPVLPIQSAVLLASMAGVLEAWLERHQGLETRLTVRAHSQVSDALLHSLGATVFHGLSGRWTGLPKADLVAADVLDLSACRPLGAPAPAIAPPPDYFESAGFAETVTPLPGALPDAGVLLGRTGRGDREEPVRFAARDRSRHCYVIGATGTGKSTLISNMVLQDIREGAGACVLDPHGDLYAELVRSVPGHRADDVIAVDLADPDRAIGLNLLESRGKFARQQVSFAINEILNMFWMLYAGVPEALGPAFEQYMRNTLMVLAQNARGPGTVADVMPFYEDPVFRRRVLETCTNPAAASFFTQIAHKTSGEAGFANMAPYITNKLNRFVGSDFVRPIIGQARSTIDFRTLMDEGKVLLVNLNKGVLGDIECRLVGMLLLAKLFSAAFERSAEPKARRRPFHLYVDEAQNFLTPIVGSILAEARKFGLSMTLANQNLAQWTGGSSRSLLDTILGNVGSLLLFRVGPEDAERLSTFTRPEFSARDLQYLPDRTVVAKMLANGRPLPPFTFETLPPMAEAGEYRDELLQVRLRQNFEAHSRARDAIEVELGEAHAVVQPTSDAGKSASMQVGGTAGQGRPD